MNHSQWLDPGTSRLRPAPPHPLPSAVNPYAFSFISFYQSSMSFVRRAEGWVFAESWPRKLILNHEWEGTGLPCRRWNRPAWWESHRAGSTIRGACQFIIWFAVLLRLVLYRLACPRGVSTPSKGLSTPSAGLGPEPASFTSSLVPKDIVRLQSDSPYSC